jgi:hypothetical protein
MAKRGRPSLLIPTVEWKLRIPIDLAAKADLIHLDPIRGNLKYGARSELITILLRDYLDKLRVNGDDNPSINLPENPNV